MLYYLAKFILYILGWKLIGLPPKKAVLIGYPHTSIYEGILMFIVSFIFNGYTIVKSENFFIANLAKLFGQITIVRNKKMSQTEQISEKVKKLDKCVILISPEGTRKKANRIKTGFYYIAKEANVPIVCGFCNPKRKELLISQELINANNYTLEDTVKKINSIYSKVNLNDYCVYPENITEFKI